MPASNIREVTKTDVLSPAREAAMINLINKIILKCDDYVYRSKEPQDVSFN